MLTVGDSEVENGSVSVRGRGEKGDLGAMSVSDFIYRAVNENETKALKQTQE